LGSRDHAEAAQKRAAVATGESGFDAGGGGGGEGALHKAARGAVATLKEVLLRSPLLPSDGGAQ